MPMNPAVVRVTQALHQHHDPLTDPLRTYALTHGDDHPGRVDSLYPRERKLLTAPAFAFGFRETTGPTRCGRAFDRG